MEHKPDETSYVAMAIDHLGGDTAVAKLANLKTSWAVSKWRVKLPADRVLWLSAATDWLYTPHMLDSKLYPNETDGLPKARSQLEKERPRTSL